MYDLAGENGLDLEALHTRLRRMSDRELVRFGQAARYMCSPEANLSKENLRRISDNCAAVKGFSGVKPGLFAICSPSE